MPKSYYEILGVEKGANESEIKKAMRFYYENKHNIDRKKGMARSITSTKEIEKNNLLIKAKVSCLDGSVSIYSEETSDYTNLDDQISKLSQYFIENNAKEIIRR